MRGTRSPGLSTVVIDFEGTTSALSSLRADDEGSRYNYEDPIGDGGHGVVYRVTREITTGPMAFALKLLDNPWYVVRRRFSMPSLLRTDVYCRLEEPPLTALRDLSRRAERCHVHLQRVLAKEDLQGKRPEVWLGALARLFIAGVTRAQSDAPPPTEEQLQQLTANAPRSFQQSIAQALQVEHVSPPLPLSKWSPLGVFVRDCLDQVAAAEEHGEWLLARVLDKCIAEAHPMGAEHGELSETESSLICALADMWSADTLLDPCFGLGVSASVYCRQGPRYLRVKAVAADPHRALMGLLRALVCGVTEIELVIADTTQPVPLPHSFAKATCALICPRWGPGKVGVTWQDHSLRGIRRSKRPPPHFVENALLRLALDVVKSRVVLLSSHGLLFRAHDRKLREELLRGEVTRGIIVMPTTPECDETRILMVVAKERRAPMQHTTLIRLPPRPATPVDEVLKALDEQSVTSPLARDVAPDDFVKGIDVHLYNSDKSPPFSALRDQNSWFPLVPLGDAVEVISGVTARRCQKLKEGESPSEKSIAVIRIKDLRGPQAPSPHVFLGPAFDALSFPNKLILDGDVLLTIKCTIGDIVPIRNKPEQTFVPSDSLVILRPRQSADGPLLATDYLVELLRTPLYNSWLRTLARGTTNQKRLCASQIRNLGIPLPPTGVQHRLCREPRSSRVGSLVDRIWKAVRSGPSREHAQSSLPGLL